MAKLEHKLIKMKIGILGSSFNPPHIGHLKISKKAIKDFGLDQVWWLITKKNPLKKSDNYIDFDNRLKKINSIIDTQKIECKYFEKETLSNFLIDNLKYMKNLYQENQFIFLMGSDSFIEMEKWKDYDEIFNEIPIAVFNRDKSKYNISSSNIGRKYEKYRLNSNIETIFMKKLPSWTFISNFNESISSTSLRTK
jgi:nicotinate-nucleotide adenylyltransferase|tara:strand:- start:107 stop:691 length:585 start_codon:yes stop_codon:yes gene_type:complete